MSVGDNGLAWIANADSGTPAVDWAGGAVDGFVDTATAHQWFIRGGDE